MARTLTPKKALQRAVDICGSQSELARRLGGKIKQQHVHYWLENGLSAVQAIPIERAVNGAVTRHDLRPDVFGEKAEAA